MKKILTILSVAISAAFISSCASSKHVAASDGSYAPADNGSEQHVAVSEDGTAPVSASADSTGTENSSASKAKRKSLYADDVYDAGDASSKNEKKVVNNYYFFGSGWHFFYLRSRVIYSAYNPYALYPYGYSYAPPFSSFGMSYGSGIGLGIGFGIGFGAGLGFYSGYSGGYYNPYLLNPYSPNLFYGGNPLYANGSSYGPRYGMAGITQNNFYRSASYVPSYALQYGARVSSASGVVGGKNVLSMAKMSSASRSASRQNRLEARVSNPPSAPATQKVQRQSAQVPPQARPANAPVANRQSADLKISRENGAQKMQQKMQANTIRRNQPALRPASKQLPRQEAPHKVAPAPARRLQQSTPAQQRVDVRARQKMPTYPVYRTAVSAKSLPIRNQRQINQKPIRMNVQRGIPPVQYGAISHIYRK